MKAQPKNQFLTAMKSNPLNRFRSARAGALATSILLACGSAHAVDIAATGTQATATDTWNLATWSGGQWTGGLAPSAGNTYSTGAFQIRSSASIFGGDSLRVVTGGSLLLRQGSNATATIGTLILDGGTLIAGVSVAGTQNISGNVNVASDSIIDLSLGGANFRRIALTSGGLSGSGKITINGGRNANDYFFANTASASSHTGNWDINAGRVIVSADDQIGSSARVTLGSATLAFLDLRSNQTIGSLSGNGTVQTNSGSRILTTGGDGTTTTFDGVISGATGTIALTKEGIGAFTLSNGLNSFAGAININGGTLEFSGTNAGLNIFGSTQININGASTLKVSGTATNVRLFDGRNYTFDSVGGGKIELGAGGNYDAGVAAQPFSITTNGGAQNTIKIINDGVSGPNGFNLGGSVATFNVALGSDATSDLVVTPIISNNGSILKTGTGRLTLAAANTYAGATTITQGTLILDGSTSASSTVGVGTAGTLAGSGTVNGNATLTGGGIINKASGTIGGTLGVTGGFWNGAGAVTGLVTSSSGTFTVSNGANLTASSGVSATGGTLVVNGTLTGTLGANSSTTVSGNGTITGNTTISGIHSPGNSPGIQSYGSNLSYTTGSSVTWELVSDSIGIRGTDFDGINVGGTLDFTGATTLNLVFNFAGSTVDWTDTFWDTSHTGTSGWLVYDVATATTNFSNLSVTAADWLDGSGGLFSGSNSGNTFSLFQNGNEIYLNYNVVPEPRAALLGGLGLLCLLRRRRA